MNAFAKIVQVYASSAADKQPGDLVERNTVMSSDGQRTCSTTIAPSMGVRRGGTL
ncbi:hypothetical protein K443DRAFT_678085 [Laccaria amethystina LaAM-08-1]|uniref:Uncharacterized protein n=1 Tax=Laccaria amethystina LaAM-08-1 TaxID=1095629 RepID=A0A0C9Y142_9AGAR|nr:hypothetical protein K443DRAFT_678085 [Laccaria amethystina LaAM-08-1]